MPHIQNVQTDGSAHLAQYPDRPANARLRADGRNGKER